MGIFCDILNALRSLAVRPSDGSCYMADGWFETLIEDLTDGVADGAQKTLQYGVSKPCAREQLKQSFLPCSGRADRLGQYQASWWRTICAVVWSGRKFRFRGCLVGVQLFWYVWTLYRSNRVAGRINAYCWQIYIAAAFPSPFSVCTLHSYRPRATNDETSRLGGKTKPHFARGMKSPEHKYNIKLMP